MMQKLASNELTFKIAEDEWERLEARYIIEHTFIEELGYPDIRPDIYNQVAIFITANLADKIIGTVRLIPDSDLGLPLDDYIDLSNIRKPNHKLVELSRLACIKEYRSFQIALKGIGYVKHVCESIGATHALIDSFLHTARLYRRMGFKPIGEPFFDPTVARNKKNDSKPNAILLCAEVKDIAVSKIVGLRAQS